MHKNINNFLLTQLDLDGLRAALSPERQQQLQQQYRQQQQQGTSPSSAPRQQPHQSNQKSSSQQLNNQQQNQEVSSSRQNSHLSMLMSDRRGRTGATGTSPSSAASSSTPESRSIQSQCLGGFSHILGPHHQHNNRDPSILNLGANVDQQQQRRSSTAPLKNKNNNNEDDDDTVNSSSQRSFGSLQINGNTTEVIRHLQQRNQKNNGHGNNNNVVGVVDDDFESQPPPTRGGHNNNTARRGTLQPDDEFHDQGRQSPNMIVSNQTDDEDQKRDKNKNKNDDSSNNNHNNNKNDNDFGSSGSLRPPKTMVTSPSGNDVHSQLESSSSPPPPSTGASSPSIRNIRKLIQQERKKSPGEAEDEEENDDEQNHTAEQQQLQDNHHLHHNHHHMVATTTTPSDRAFSFAGSFNSNSPSAAAKKHEYQEDQQQQNLQTHHEQQQQTPRSVASSMQHLQQDLESTSRAAYELDEQTLASVNDSVHDPFKAYFSISNNPWRLSFPTAPDSLTFDYARLLGSSYMFDQPLGRRPPKVKANAEDAEKQSDEQKEEQSIVPPTLRRKKVAIIGAGVAGSIVARELARTGLYDVDVYESSNRVGGRMWSQRALGCRKVKDQETGEEKEETFAQLTCHEMGAMRFPLFNTSQPLKPGSGPWVGGPYHFSWQDQLGPRTADKPVPINSLSELYLQMFEISTAAFPDPGKAPGVTLQSMVARKASTIMSRSAQMIMSRQSSLQRMRSSDNHADGGSTSQQYLSQQRQQSTDFFDNHSRAASYALLSPGGDKNNSFLSNQSLGGKPPMSQKYNKFDHHHEEAFGRFESLQNTVTEDHQQHDLFGGDEQDDKSSQVNNNSFSLISGGAASFKSNNNTLSYQQKQHQLFDLARKKKQQMMQAQQEDQTSTITDEHSSESEAANNHSHRSLDLAHVMENQIFSSEEGYEGVRTSVYVNNGWGVDLCSMYPEQFPDESCLPSKTFAYDWPADSPSILFPAAQMFPSVVWFHNGEARPDLHVPQIVLDHCIPKVDANDLHKYIPKNFGTPETNEHYEKDVIAWSKGIDALRTTLYKWSIFSGLFLWAISNQSDGFLLDGLPIEKTEETWNQMRFDAGHANWEEFWFKKVMPHYQNKSFSSIVTAAPIIPTEKTANGRKWKCPKEILDGNFGGLGVNAGELSLLGTLGLSDGSWQPFYPLSSLWILRAILFGFANQHQLFLGACLNKKQSDVDDSRLDHIDRTPYGVSGRKQIKDSNGNDFNAPQYVGATSISEMNFFSPLDVRDLKKNKEDRTTPSLYELATNKTKKNNNNSNKYGNVNMFLNTKVTALTRHGDYNIEVTSEATAKPKENDDEPKMKMKSTRSTTAVEETHRKYDFTVCTVPLWNTGIMTLKGFKEGGVPLSTQTALETAHWIRSAKVFIPLKEAFWITHKDVLSPVIVSDTILQDCYCLLAPSTEEEKKENPNHLQGGICLLAYCWQDNAQRFLSFQQKDLVKLLVSKINQVWSNSGITDYKFEDFCVDPTFEREGAYSVWCWSLQEGYHGCAKAYLAGNENSNSLLLNFNNYFAKKSQLYFAGDAYGNESGWIETGALRLSVDCVLNMINNDPDAELEDFDGTFDFDTDYYHSNLLSVADAQKNLPLGPYRKKKTNNNSNQKKMK